MSTFITSADLPALLRDGRTELVLNEGDRLTDLAREMLRARGVQIRTEPLSGSAVASACPEPPGSPERTGQPPFLRQEAVAQSAAGSPPARQPAADPESAPYDLVVFGGTCVIPEVGCLRANVCIRDGKVAALTAEPARGAREIDASGLFVLPGIIDPHTHLGLFVPLEEELVTETRSALLGGVTTIGTYFNQEGSYLPLLDRLERSVSALSRVDMIPHLALRDETQLNELPAYSERGMNSYKVYMCGVPGLYPHQEDGFILRAMDRMNRLPPRANPLLSIHCENASICDYATEDRKNLPIRTLEDWNGTHPNLAEGEAVLRAAYLSQKTGVRTYLVHSSTREAMEVLRPFRHPGLYVETTSPYLSLDTDSPIGAYGKMLPPIREPGSRDALWDAIREGGIDTIGTDNTVMTSREKRVADGMKGAGAGYPTLGTHLASVLNEGIFHREVSLEKLVPLMTMNPAKIFGIYPRKGTILPGSDADLVLVDLNAAKTVDPSALLSRSDFSLFQGRTLRGWPCATIKGGAVVAWHGTLVDDTRRGSVLRH